MLPHRAVLKHQTNLQGARRQRLLLHAPQPQLHRVAPASAQGPAPVVNADPDAPIGMTAPSSKHCAVGHRKNNGRKFTSLVKTMMR